MRPRVVCFYFLFCYMTQLRETKTGCFLWYMFYHGINKWLTRTTFLSTVEHYLFVAIKVGELSISHMYKVTKLYILLILI